MNVITAAVVGAHDEEDLHICQKLFGTMNMSMNHKTYRLYYIPVSNLKPAFLNTYI